MSTPIANVSDTSFWVCQYRAEETQRADALFSDPYAGRLSGDKGRAIAKRMPFGKYTRWSVVVRTVIIDDLVHEAIKQGVDTVLCLGAGLDARPYRLNLGDQVHWVEVDYAHVIAYKEKILANDKPGCRLRRIALDLADRPARRDMLAEVTAKANKVLVITEGLIPYLSNEQVADLADDLRAQSNVSYWIVEYMSRQIMRFVRKRHAKNLANAPFKFDPDDWTTFFAARGWRQKICRYLTEASRQRGRRVPEPWFVQFVAWLPGVQARRKQMEKMSAYAMLERAS